MGVDVVVVTADTREMVLSCLERLGDPEIESLTVVDNASSDGTAEAIRERFPATKLVSLDEPVGFASACNRGAERGQAELVLFLNSDILAAEGAIGRLAQELAVHREAVAGGGRLVDPGSNVTQHEYGPKPFPTLTTFTVRLSGLEQLWPRNPWTSPHLRHPLDDRETAAVDQPAGACFLARREAFETVGGFDERFWFWYEDVDLARRLSRLGSILYVPAAVFEHVGGGTFKRWSRAQGIRSLLHGVLHYAEVHFSRPRKLGLGLLLLAMSAPRAVVFSLFDPDLARTHRAVMWAAVALMRGHPVPRLV